MDKLTEEQVKEELRKPLGYISKWLIQLRRECSKAEGYTPGEKQVVHMNLSKIQTELKVAKLMLKEDCFPLISSLLQKEREAGKREGIEMINEKISILQKDKALYKNRKDNDFYVVRIGELASLRDELKSQLVEKGKK